MACAMLSKLMEHHLMTVKQQTNSTGHCKHVTIISVKIKVYIIMNENLTYNLMKNNMLNGCLPAPWMDELSKNSHYSSA